MSKSYFEEKQFFFESQAGGLKTDTFSVVSFSGDEGISKLYRYTVNLISKNPDIDLEAVLASPATLYLKGDRTLPIHGVLAEFEQLNEIDENYYYRAVLVPTFWHLTRFRMSEVFMKKTVPEIIELVIQAAGLTSFDYEIALQNPSGYRRWSYICQYEESYFDFLSRRMERDGIYYYFEQGDTQEKLIITDTEFRHVDIPGQSVVHYSPPSGLDSQVQQEVATAFINKRKPMPAKVICQDFNYRKSPPVITGEAVVSPDGLGEVCLYGGHIKTTEEAESYAQIRAQEILSRQQIGSGESTAPFLCSGYLFDLKHHYRQDCNRKYLLTSIHHEGSQAALFLSGDGLKLSGEETHPYYRNSFETIPDEVQFRPERSTPWPRFSGTINAKITADGDGQYAEIDQFGRYKVKLPFDRSDRTGQKASRWVRMAQPYQGPDESMHFPLRKNAEVILTFIDGDPDRPVIAGAVPSAEGQSHIVNTNATKNLIKTAGGNQLHFQDRQGQQRILMRSPTENSWLRIGYPNDPPSPYQVNDGDTITSYTDDDGQWNLLDPDSSYTASEANDGDGTTTLTFGLPTNLMVKCKRTEGQVTYASHYNSDQGRYETITTQVLTDKYTLSAISPEQVLSTVTTTVTKTYYRRIIFIPGVPLPAPDEQDSQSEGSPPQVDAEYSIGGKTYRVKTVPEFAANEAKNIEFYRLKDVTLKILDMRKTEYRNGVRIRSDGNYWREALDRDGEYIVGMATDAPKKDASDSNAKPLIGDLIAKFGSSYNPSGLKDRHTGDSLSMDDALKNARIYVTSLDTFMTREGSIYDFGGHPTYNFRGRYAENHMAAETGDGSYEGHLNHDSLPKDKATNGGPSFGSVEDLTDHNENVWVVKNIGGAAYQYTYDKDHLNVNYECKMMNHHYGGREEEYVYEPNPDDEFKKIIEKTSEAGHTEEKTWDMNTGDLMSHYMAYTTQGSLKYMDFAFCAKAKAKFTFGFSTSFTIHTDFSLNFKNYLGVTAEIKTFEGLEFKLKSGLAATLKIDARKAGVFELQQDGTLESKFPGVDGRAGMGVKLRDTGTALYNGGANLWNGTVNLWNRLVTVQGGGIEVNDDELIID